MKQRAGVGRTCLPLLLLLPVACALAQGPVGGAPAASARTGAVVFPKYCVLCHGEEADGNGVAAHLHDPRPANLTISPYPDAYNEDIIRNGGKALGRSAGMPPWGKELSDAEIKSVVAYIKDLRSLNHVRQ
jgi:mono/diheme cytochrome c family protein